MKYIATVIKTTEYQTPLWARDRKQASELLEELDEADFLYQDVVDCDVKIEEVIDDELDKEY